MKRPVRTKLDHCPRQQDQDMQDRCMDSRDKQYKEKITAQTGNRYLKEHKIQVDDFVLLKLPKKNKIWSTAYEPLFYIVIRIDGSSIAARRISDGREVYRDSN